MDLIFRKGKQRSVAPIGGKLKDPAALEAYQPQSWGERCARNWLLLTEQLGYDLHFTCMDDVTVAKSLGLKTFKVKDGSEHVQPDQVNTPEDLLKLKVKEALQSDFVERIVAPFKHYKLLGGDRPIGGGCFGPLTVAGAIIGVDKLNMMLVTNPDFVHEVLEIVLDFTVGLVKLCQANQADYVWIAEPLAVMLAPKQFQTFSADYIKAIFDSVNLPGFLHVCGDTTRLTAQLVATGASCLSIDYLVNLRHMAQTVHSNVLLMGNINPVFVATASRQEVEQATLALLYQMRNHPNFIMSTGCLLPPVTPVENIEALCAATKRYPVKTDSEYLMVKKISNAFTELNQAVIEQTISSLNPQPSSLLDGLEEALHSLGRAYQNKEINFAEFLKQINEIYLYLQQKPLNTDYQIMLNNTKYEWPQLSSNLLNIMLAAYHNA